MEAESLTAYPDLPMIRWGVFVSRVRIRWAHGICCESFALPHAEPLEGTDKRYRKLDMKKPMPKPMTKKEKGKEKGGKKSCK